MRLRRLRLQRRTALVDGFGIDCCVRCCDLCCKVLVLVLWRFRHQWLHEIAFLGSVGGKLQIWMLIAVALVAVL